MLDKLSFMRCILSVLCKVIMSLIVFRGTRINSSDVGFGWLLNFETSMSVQVFACFALACQKVIIYEGDGNDSQGLIPAGVVKEDDFQEETEARF